METYNFPPFPAKGERRLFMPSNYTPNYQLNQWEADDRVLRTDFNADNEKIDAALAALAKGTPKIRAGWFLGDGKSSQKVELDFSPDAVITFCSDPPSRSGGSLYGGVAVVGSWPQMKSGSTPYNGLKIHQTGFTVWENSSVNIHCNMSGVEYAYIAFEL